MTVMEAMVGEKELASRRAFEIEQDETTRVEQPVSDDHRPKIAS
jgi:hypothetical protein